MRDGAEEHAIAAREGPSAEPRELPEEKAPGAYDYRGQAIYVRDTEEGYTARVTGSLALRHSPDQGVKTLAAETESLARRAAELWVDAQHDGQDEGEREPEATCY